jgi:hypothetical protein
MRNRVKRRQKLCHIDDAELEDVHTSGILTIISDCMDNTYQHNFDGLFNICYLHLIQTSLKCDISSHKLFLIFYIFNKLKKNKIKYYINIKFLI